MARCASRRPPVTAACSGSIGVTTAQLQGVHPRMAKNIRDWPIRNRPHSPSGVLHKLRPLPSVFANIRCGFATASRERHGLWRSRLRELIHKSRDISGNCPCLARLIPRAMEHQAALLLWRLGLNKPHRRPLVLLKAQFLKAQASQPDHHAATTSIQAGASQGNEAVRL